MSAVAFWQDTKLSLALTLPSTPLNCLVLRTHERLCTSGSLCRCFPNSPSSCARQTCSSPFNTGLRCVSPERRIPGPLPSNDQGQKGQAGAITTLMQTARASAPVTLVDLHRSPMTQRHPPTLQTWKGATRQPQVQLGGKPALPQSRAWPPSFSTSPCCHLGVLEAVTSL